MVDFFEKYAISCYIQSNDLTSQKHYKFYALQQKDAIGVESYIVLELDRKRSYYIRNSFIQAKISHSNLTDKTVTFNCKQSIYRRNRKFRLLFC